MKRRAAFRKCLPIDIQRLWRFRKGFLATACAASVCVIAAAPAAGARPSAIDHTVLKAIRTEGLDRSDAMRIEAELTDRIGARLTGSPAFEQALAWAAMRLRAVGAPSVAVERWGPFGLAWTQLGASISVSSPMPFPIAGQVTPWSPGTSGAVEGPALLLPKIRSEAELAVWRGRLRGAVILYGAAPVVDPDHLPRLLVPDAAARRIYATTAERSRVQENIAAYRSLNVDERAYAFFKQEGAVAVLKAAGTGGVLRVDETATMGWRPYLPGHRQTIASAAIPTESYGRIARLLAAGAPVRVALNLRVTLGRPDAPGGNVVAEIKGTDPAVAGEIVMMGGHLDSWTAATGATDDGAAVAVMIEAMRILHAAGVHPRRTIRVGLWGGEEQGTLGSLAYVQRHLGRIDFPSSEGDDAVPRSFAMPTHIEPGPGAARIKAYFNMDKGAGALMGVATRGNETAAAAALGWMPVVRDLGFDTVTTKAEAQVDSDSFAKLGVPVFDFYQPPRDDERTHHTNLDTLERVRPADLAQAATVAATLLYLAAQDEAPTRGSVR
jgi:hypothetical protein